MEGGTLTGNWGVEEFDPWDPRIGDHNVWAIYRAMREAGAAVRSEAHGGFWSITRYADLRAAAADHGTFASGQGVFIGRRKAARGVPIELDRPEHTWYRKALQGPFLAGRVGALADTVREHVEALLDHVERARDFDIVADIAEPLPLRVISDFLGIPRGARQEQHARLAGAYVGAELARVERAMDDYRAFIRDEVRAGRGGEGFIGALWELERDGQPVDEDEVVRMTFALALAGHHTTINGIASTLLRMADPDARHRFGDPAWAERVTEEVLRRDPPIHLEGRTTTSAVRLGDTDIPRGAKVALLFASGNHDDEVFADPERFDPGRSGPSHLSFGHGLHKCLGAHLARLEMRIVLEEVLRRFPAYRLTAPPVGTGMVFGHHMGWRSVPATTGPGSGSG